MLFRSVDHAHNAFRRVTDTTVKVRYQLKDKLQESSRFINLPLASTVTSCSQVKLMKQMYVFGEEFINYCDTDSIVGMRHKNAPSLTKQGLGNWSNEHPDKVIETFLALAPKSYMEIISNGKGEKEVLLKYKGVRMTESNRHTTSIHNMLKLIEDVYFNRKTIHLEADTMTIHPNSTNHILPYGQMCTRYGKKIIQCVTGSKRKLHTNQKREVESLKDVSLIRLVPEGYTGSHGHIYNL